MLVDLGLFCDRAPVPWVEPEGALDGLPAFRFVMVVGAVRLRTRASVGRATLFDLVVHDVVFGFFPAMAVATAVLQRAAFGVRARLSLRGPSGALVLGVVVDVLLAPEVLPVVRVNTGITWMTLILFV